MALINSPVLPSQASEALKSPMAQAGSQEPVAPDAFSQTLRKQMAQAKPSSPENKPASSKNETKTEQSATSHESPEQPENASVATGHTEPEATASGKNVPQRPAKSGAKSKVDDASGQAAVDTAMITAHPAAVGNPASTTDRTNVADAKSDDKKPSADVTEEQNPAAAGIMPWMQTMLAMRGSQPADTTKGAVDSGLTIGNGRFVATGQDKAAVQSGSGEALQPATASVKDTLTSAVTGTQDGKQPAIASKSDKAGEGFAALLTSNKLANTEISLPKGMEQGIRGHESTPVSPTLTMPPMLEAMQNSPWLQAAGVTDMSQVVTTQITTPFTDERWQAAINQHVMQMASQSDEVASLTLSPPDLGPIQVVLKVDNQSVNPSFITDNPLVRQALEDGMQDLRDRMQSQGLQLGQTFVGNGQQAQQHFEQQSGREGARASASAADADTALTPQTAVQPRVVRGLVDTFV
ncbi:flagellar hook-length control protein FliK [Methylophilus sp. 3sh_L]|uniref:flagellar hook-length control protein FliK n=1 Tax=Methylophilus sp. 3sh_L TaxID=3377114 RepID=UPI00398F6AA2